MKTIFDMLIPANEGKLQIFFGIVAYLGKFIPHMSDASASLQSYVKNSIYLGLYRFHLAALLRRADYMRERNILGESHLAVNKLGARSCVNSQKRKYFLFSWQRLLFKKFGKTNFFLL